MVITITCLTTHRLITILPDDRQATLLAWLKDLPQEIKARVVAVCADLKEAPPCGVIARVLPHAVLEADHFHVLQDATRSALGGEETRRLEQSEARTTLSRWPLVKGQERLIERPGARLEILKSRFPTLAEQHWLKEELRTLYKCTDQKAAQAHWQRIRLNGEAADDAETVRWARTLRRWGQEILGYFQYPITNAYTEGCHTKLVLSDLSDSAYAESLPKGSNC